MLFHLDRYRCLRAPHLAYLVLPLVRSNELSTCPKRSKPNEWLHINPSPAELPGVVNSQSIHSHCKTNTRYACLPGKQASLLLFFPSLSSSNNSSQNEQLARISRQTTSNLKRQTVPTYLPTTINQPKLCCAVLQRKPSVEVEARRTDAVSVSVFRCMQLRKRGVSQSVTGEPANAY